MIAKQNPTGRPPTRALSLWLDLEEIVRYVTDNVPEQVRWPLVHFSADQWVELVYRGKGEKKAALRTFERWKQQARQLGVFSTPDPGVLFYAPTAVYAVDGRTVAERAAQAAERHVPTLPKRPDRDVPIKTAFASLGIGYSLPKIEAWRELGMPVRVAKRGSRRFWFVNPAELEAWVEKAAREGLIFDPLAAKMPIEEAAPILIQVRKDLGLSLKRMAKLLNTTHGRLNSYMRLGTAVRTVPRQIVENAQALLEAGVAKEKYQLRRGAPPLEEIRNATLAAKGKLPEASAALRAAGYTSGISLENLRRLAINYEIPYADWSTRQVEIPSEEELRKILAATRYRVRSAAREIGVSPTHLRRVIERQYPKLLELIEFYKIDKQALIEAAEAANFDIQEAAALLDLDRGNFRRMLAWNGLTEWFDAKGQLPPGASAAGANPARWSNRRSAVGWSWAPFRP